MSAASRDFFAYRRALAGVPDRPPTTPCGLLVPTAAAIEAAAMGVRIVCGLPECKPCATYSVRGRRTALIDRRDAD